MQKILSIIIPAHNAEKFIKRALDSLMQGISGAEQYCEIILINDGSKDNTARFLLHFAREHCEWVKLFTVNYKNVGKVRNFAVHQCSGQYVTMLDSDDLILKGSLVTIIKILQEKNPDLLLTKIREIYSKKQIDSRWSLSDPVKLSQKECSIRFLKHKELQSHFIGQVIKRTLLLNAPFPEFICYEDAFLFPEIVKVSHNILYAKDSFYLYMKNNNSLSSRLNPEKIKLLFLAKENMDRLFSDEFKNLVAVHWIILFEKYHHWLQDEKVKNTVGEKIAGISFWHFLFDPHIRLSAKLKFLKVRKLVSSPRRE